MANTVISLKKSSIPTAEPTTLANGELAINYADGKLFYKHANGTILPFNTTGGNAFGAVNANGTLVVAGTSEAILTLISGNNISIVGDAINDTITINSIGGASVNIGENPPTTPIEGDLWWSSNIGSLFIYYNDGNTSQWVETSQSAAYANTAEQIAIAAFTQANTSEDIAIAAYAQANAASLISAAGNDTEVQFNNSGSFGASAGFTFDSSANNLSVANTVSATHFDNVSDISLKENINPIYPPHANKNIIYHLNPVSFNWKDTDNKSYGLIAQEVEQILPSIVHSKQDGTKTVNYIEIIAFLIAAVQDLQNQIDDINRK